MNVGRLWGETGGKGKYCGAWKWVYSLKCTGCCLRVRRLETLGGLCCQMGVRFWMV